MFSEITPDSLDRHHSDNRGPYMVVGIEPESAAYKARVHPTVLSLQYLIIFWRNDFLFSKLNLEVVWKR